MSVGVPWKEIIFFKGDHVVHDISMNPVFEDWSYTCSETETALNTLRERIHEYETGDDCKWEYYKKIINPYELVYTQKKYANFPESVCMIHPLSRSFFKMIEILAVSDFFKTFEHDNRFRTAHVCEGPGGFMEAMIEEVTKRRKIAAQLTAMTLRPNQTNVPGWKRASQFLQKNKSIKIIYGDDNTGDITRTINQASFVTACGPKVHIFTSDGGFDFSTDYLQQERFVFPLLLSSTRIGFEVLKDGGYFILKFFDTYHSATLDLIYLLSCHFRSWSLYKPATSRPCNPEQYFIGRGYRSCSTKTMEFLKQICKEVEKGTIPSRLFHISLPAEFQTTINSIRDSVLKKQTHYLGEVFTCIEKAGESDIRAILQKHEYLSYTWCTSFNVPVYPARSHSIEASRSGQQGAGRQ